MRLVTQLPRRLPYFSSTTLVAETPEQTMPGAWPSFSNASLSKCIVHRASGNVAHVRQDVALDAEGEAHVSMSQQFLDELGLYTLLE
jgi:hypothetical protein